MWESRTLGEISKLRGVDHPAIMLRILLLPPGNNPDSISTSLLAVPIAKFLAWLHVVTLISEVIDV
jgi:hypothetical protein